MQKTLIVVDSDTSVLSKELPNVISFEEYLHDYPKLDEPKLRIINLCNSERYLSQGYYCSLLAEARQHEVMPSVKVINGLRNFSDEFDDFALSKADRLELKEVTQDTSCLVYFGKSNQPSLQRLARRIFTLYPTTLFQLCLKKKDDGRLDISVNRYSFSDLSETERSEFLGELKNHLGSAWRLKSARKSHRWDMAILVNPEEKVPPSDKSAIANFIKAAGKQGIRATAVTATELQDIALYDALFIRETTAIDHHTYRLAVKAEQKGLVVIDDPVSILRCCNKVFLHDAFNYKNVPSLNTRVVSDNSEATLDTLEQQFSYPMVLKMPEGSFSMGVFKVTDRPALKEKLNTLLQDSALALVQEYLYTDFDWRIGVLNGQAIYACRYEMARNHWQIYNHGNKRFSSGGFETLPTFEVPRPVLDAALRAARIIGNGLYGVDVKESGGKAYVLEVNDNPSIESKVEDAYLGNELYMHIMSEFLRRLEDRGR
ncbi:RimK family protein [Porticoccaceae bacterium LTM1]|nr:RimK family protein [Porticoccaceae bacterium LTM1]